MVTLDYVEEQQRHFAKQAWLAACGSGTNSRMCDFTLDGYQAAVTMDCALTDAGMSFKCLGPSKANQGLYIVDDDENDMTVMVAPMMCFNENACVLIVEFPDRARWVKVFEGAGEQLPHPSLAIAGERAKWDELYDFTYDTLTEAAEYQFVRIPPDYTPPSVEEEELSDEDEPVKKDEKQENNETIVEQPTEPRGARKDVLDRFLDKLFGEDFK